MEEKRILFSKPLKVLQRCDVLVAGGGIAGCNAAIAAARAGAQVLLVEGYGFLGGTPALNAGPHFCFCGDTANQGEIFDELVAGLEALKALGHPGFRSPALGLSRGPLL